jgi:hypothetical protein
LSDLYCQRCGEPFELDYIMNDMTPEEKKNFETGVCCPACKGENVEKRPFRSQIQNALRGVLGDDVDGLASEMEDAESLLGSKFWE